MRNKYVMNSHLEPGTRNSISLLSFPPTVPVSSSCLHLNRVIEKKKIKITYVFNLWPRSSLWYFLSNSDIIYCIWHWNQLVTSLHKCYPIQILARGSNISEQSTDYGSSAKEISEWVSDGQMGWSWESHGTAYVKGL